MRIERAIDRQTVLASDGSGQVEHGASARANLEAIVDSARRMRFDHTYEALATYAHGAAMRDMREYFGVQPEASPELTALKGIAMLPLGLARDALEIALAPVLVVKDALDAAVHGLIAGFGGGD